MHRGGARARAGSASRNVGAMLRLEEVRCIVSRQFRFADPAAAWGIHSTKTTRSVRELQNR